MVRAAGLARLLEEEGERQWASMAVFTAFVLIGAMWLSQAQLLPGVASSDLDAGGTVVDIAWASDGIEAVAIVDSGGQDQLRARLSDGAWVDVSCACTPLDVTLGPSGWLVGGEMGFFGLIGHLDGENVAVSPRTLSFPDAVRGDLEVISVSGGLSEGWLVTEAPGGVTQLRSYIGLAASAPATAELDRVQLDSVHAISGGALVLGHDDEHGNPTSGPSGEVLLDAVAVPGEAPRLRLLHLAGGATFHTVMAVPETSSWSAFDALVAGGSNLYGVSASRDVTVIPGALGSDGAALIGDKVWMLVDGGLATHTFAAASSTLHETPFAMPTGAHVAATGDVLQLVDAREESRIRVDTLAASNVFNGLGAMGDLAFATIVIGGLVVGGIRVWRTAA